MAVTLPFAPIVVDTNLHLPAPSPFIAMLRFPTCIRSEVTLYGPNRYPLPQLSASVVSLTPGLLPYSLLILTERPNVCWE